MDKLTIHGNAELSGSIAVPGAKNASLPIMASSLLTDQLLHLENMPDLVDVKMMKQLLESFGVTIKINDRFMSLLSNKITNHVADYNLVRKMRASILVLGPLLARVKKVKIS